MRIRNLSILFSMAVFGHLLLLSCGSDGPGTTPSDKGGQHQHDHPKDEKPKIITTPPQNYSVDKVQIVELKSGNASGNYQYNFTIPQNIALDGAVLVKKMWWGGITISNQGREKTYVDKDSHHQSN